MTSIKRLRSVVHSTGHHGMSGLCYVHPHLGEACKKQKITSVSVNLLKEGFTPQLKSITKEINLSTTALRKTFIEFLDKENISKKEIGTAYILFNFVKGRWPSSCYLEVTTIENKTIEVALDTAGKKAEILDIKS